jgi:DNA-binding response OmpR family regulator
MSKSVFLLEDEEQLSKVLQLTLKKIGYEVVSCSTIESARKAIDAKPIEFWPSLFLVDRNLPDGDGISFVQNLRSRGYEGGILVLSARGMSSEKVEGLEQGADDYLSKPFDIEELTIRLKVLAKRARVQPVLWNRDLNARRILGPKGWVALTPIEYKLCEMVMDNPGKTMARDELLKNVWGYQFLPKTRTVDFFWGRLRRFFELDPDNPVHFLTVRGSGYRFVADI